MWAFFWAIIHTVLHRIQRAQTLINSSEALNFRTLTSALDVSRLPNGPQTKPFSLALHFQVL